ncbi:NfeD family protein [Thermosulfurimonas dismutans]|uniref:Putative membrane-bound ClpP-class protease n=1 Tax=Thermosulfurimonas dismutans TaxID=999894 RepID=A0A179D5L6_9BACT|nr:nodulation protein NfeD [Thermosulfurimonas dismutans]OAQ21263.1 putative membrane-bound ClpP-class protease [Thermosulfurimonas dismutans]
MKKLPFSILILIVFLSLGLATEKNSSRAPILLVKIDDVITPVTTDFLLGSLEEAQQGNYQAVIWQLDTPGGLVESTRQIVKAVLASPVPVVVYVAPGGARAASAGTFIVLSAHIAAMAPGTHLGAAHPVTLIGGKIDKKTAQKIENDLAAWARSLARLRKRNEKFAEEAVTQSRTLTAEEALKARVIDFLAEDLKNLLQSLDGQKIKLDHREVTLKTTGVTILTYKQDLKTRILSILVHPQVAYLLLMLGLAGIYFELSNPGALFPGIIGAICLVMALFALHILPVNYAGLILIVLSALLYFLEIKIASYGLIALAATVCLLLGSLMLFGDYPPPLAVPYSFLIPIVSIIALFFLVVTYLAAKALHRRPVSGPEGLLGKEGYTISEVGPEGGQVFIEGEIWQAFSETPIPPKTPIKVLVQEGLKLKVKPLRQEKFGI